MAAPARWKVGDFNGDNKDDLMRSGSTGLEVFLSDGTRFTFDSLWSSEPTYTFDWQVGDFNGTARMMCRVCAMCQGQTMVFTPRAVNSTKPSNT